MVVIDWPSYFPCNRFRMFTANRFLIAFFISIAACSIGYGQAQQLEYVTLTSPAGQKIEASLISLNRGSVTIRVKGRSGTLRSELGQYSLASQEFIKHWFAERSVIEEVEFQITTRRFGSEKGTTDEVTWQNTVEGYRVQAKNDSNLSIKGLTMRYLIVVKRESLERKKPGDYRLEHEAGYLEFPELPARESIRLDTMAIPLREAKKEGVTVVAYGGSLAAKDELEGIIAEFYFKGKLIHEVAKPRTLLKRYTIHGPRRR